MTEENSQNKSLLDYFTRNEWIFLTVCFLLGIIFRFAFLDHRPVHHDESLYGAYSYYFYMDPIKKFYKYNPLLHGPFLFNVFPWIFDSFGISNWTLRLPSAFIGSFFIFLPILFRKYVNKATVLFATLVIALSPTLIYWSRFLRHDYFLIFSFLGILISLYTFPAKQKAIGALFFIALAFTIKENSYVMLAIMLGYIGFELVWHRGKSPLLQKFTAYVKTYRLECLIGLAVFSFVYCYFYTSGFKHWPGILDGIYRKSLLYWFEQHSMERLKGPFSFNFLFLSWYEQFFIFVFIFHYFYSFIKFDKLFRGLSIGLLVLSFIVYMVYKTSPDFQMLKIWQVLKLKIPLDSFLVVFYVGQSLILPFFHKRKQEDQLAFWSYLFYASFFTYSYLGEKVPWLSLYILIPGLIYFFCYFQENIKNAYEKINSNAMVKLVLIGFIVCQFRFLTMINLGRVNNKSEFIRQVHTTVEMDVYAKEIKKMTQMNKELSILSVNATTWPIAWYLRDVPNFRFFKALSWPDEEYDIIFDEVSKRSDYKDLEKDFIFTKIPFRSWWVPNYNSMNIISYLRYALLHDPWNNPGVMEVLVIKKKSTFNY